MPKFPITFNDRWLRASGHFEPEKKKKKIPLGGRHSIKDLYLVNYYPPPQFGGGRKSARVWVVGGWVGREVGEAFEVKTRQTVGVPSNQQPETSNLSGSSTHMFRWLAMRRRKENTRMTRKPFFVFFYDLSIVKISFRLPKSAVSRSATYPGMLPFSVCRWSLYFDQHFFLRLFMAFHTWSEIYLWPNRSVPKKWFP